MHDAAEHRALTRLDLAASEPYRYDAARMHSLTALLYRTVVRAAATDGQCTLQVEPQAGFSGH